MKATPFRTSLLAQRRKMYTELDSCLTHPPHCYPRLAVRYTGNKKGLATRQAFSLVANSGLLPTCASAQ